MEEELRAHLLADTALAALVSGRIAWLARPQGAALPSLTLQVISAPREYTLDGPVRTIGYLVQMDVWATTYPSMKAIARALAAACAGLTDGGFQVALIENERETLEAADGPDGAAQIFRASLDVRVWFTAAN